MGSYDSGSPSVAGEKRLPVFGDLSKEKLGRKLRDLQNLVYCTWDFTEEMLTLYIDLSRERRGVKIEFTHWRSASAYLDGFLDGFVACEDANDLVVVDDSEASVEGK